MHMTSRQINSYRFCTRLVATVALLERVPSEAHLPEYLPEAHLELTATPVSDNCMYYTTDHSIASPSFWLRQASCSTDHHQYLATLGVSFYTHYLFHTAYTKTFTFHLYNAVETLCLGIPIDKSSKAYMNVRDASSLA